MVGRKENAMSGQSYMNDDGESYRGIVPTKQPNKGDGSPAEVVEGRPRTKENTQQPNLGRTPSRGSRPSGLERVREAARKDRKLKFTALLHHVSIDMLRDSYFSLKKQAAPGVDGMTWEEYGRDLEVRIADLQGQIHRGA
jgi:RNA-directed DNA polymerase